MLIPKEVNLSHETQILFPTDRWNRMGTICTPLATASFGTFTYQGLQSLRSKTGVFEWCTYLIKRWHGVVFLQAPSQPPVVNESITTPPPKPERFFTASELKPPEEKSMAWEDVAFASPLRLTGFNRAADAHSYRSWVQRSWDQLLALDIPQWPHPWRDDKVDAPEKTREVPNKKSLKQLIC